MAEPNQKKFMDSVKKELNPEAQQTIGFLHKYAKQITIVILGIVLIIAIALGYKWYQQRHVASEQTRLGLILSGQTGAARIQALENFLQDTPAEFKPAVYFEIAFTASGLGDNAKAAENWKSGGDLLKPNDPMLAVARLGEASALNKVGRGVEGVAVLEEFLTQTNPDLYSASFLKMELAAMAEQAGEWEKSVAIYEELAAAESGEGRSFFSFRANEIKARNAAPGQTDAAAPAPVSDDAPASAEVPADADVSADAEAPVEQGE